MHHVKLVNHHKNIFSMMIDIIKAMNYFHKHKLKNHFHVHKFSNLVILFQRCKMYLTFHSSTSFTIFSMFLEPYTSVL